MPSVFTGAPTTKNTECKSDIRRLTHCTRKRKNKKKANRIIRLYITWVVSLTFLHPGVDNRLSVWLLLSTGTLWQGWGIFIWGGDGRGAGSGGLWGRESVHRPPSPSTPAVIGDRGWGLWRRNRCVAGTSSVLIRGIFVIVKPPRIGISVMCLIITSIVICSMIWNITLLGKLVGRGKLWFCILNRSHQKRTHGH